MLLLDSTSARMCQPPGNLTTYHGDVIYVDHSAVGGNQSPLAVAECAPTAAPIVGDIWVTTSGYGGGDPNASQPTPRELTFNGDSLISVIAYSALFIVAAIGNLTVFIILFRNRRRRSRVNMFIMNLSLADMMVTFVMLPLEIGWHVTVGWRAGDAACRLLMFFRVLGFYLSSFILIAISFDRYFAIMHPLSLTDADRRGKIMLFMAWVFSIVASIPQSIIFHVEVHPAFPWFAQCVTFGFFPSAAHELAYNLFNVFAMYVAPLVVILLTYSLILCEITRKSRENRQQLRNNGGIQQRAQRMRRSGIGRIEKARTRTLKMTIVIVMVFVTCWTPYFVICAWWWIDAKSAATIHPKIQRALFIFAVSNSCVNPIVYGTYARTITRELRKCFRCCCPAHASAEVPVVCGAGVLPPSSLMVAPHPGSSQNDVSSDVRDHVVDSSDKIDVTEAARLGRHLDRRHLDSYVCIGSGEKRQKTPEKMIARKLTPPHVASGRGNKERFERYLLI